MAGEKDYQIEQALEEILHLKSDDQGTGKVFKLSAFAGDYREFPDSLSPEITDLFKKKGIPRMYSHQSEAVNQVLSGKHVVVATPTASGKTLVYNTVTLNALTKEPSAKSLYLFPTKALSQDQLSELLELNKVAGGKFAIHTYDGDTPHSRRKAIRTKAQIVISNPYMLHSGILPHHTKWASLFENLKYVIIDELHFYTGVFGSHTANVIRRLRRICRFYGSDPVFIMSSATIANPGELAQKIIEEDVSLIDRSGAPVGEKYLVFFNPPVINKQLGIRRSYIATARQIASILLKKGLQIITFANTRLITEILVKYLKNDFEKNKADQGSIRGYRGGYLTEKRREIEKELRRGDIRGVVSTNALELGIDIGSLDAAVLASYPGTISSTWQRMGRAGRRAGKSIGILVSSSSPVDQFIVNHPEYFTGKSPEIGRINPDNLSILMEHVKCAAFELPFVQGESFGNEDLGEILDFLAENRVLFKRQDKWFWTEQVYPAEAVSINRISSDNFLVVERSEGEKVIGKVDFPAALYTLHPGAVYILEGEQYLVEEFDYPGRKALVVRSNSDYYTEAVNYTKITVQDIFDETKQGNHEYFYGDVRVSTQVVGFKKLKIFTRENVGGGDLELPGQEMTSTSFWMAIKNELLNSVNITPEEKLEAISGLAYLMRHIAAVMLMCDVKDLGVALEDNITKTEVNFQSARQLGEIKESPWIENFEPNIYIYENYPNGIGFSEVLFEKGDQILTRTLEVIESCPCDQGCPSCVGPSITSGRQHKEAARFILKLLVNQLYQ